jgi:hypothetical protein
MLPKGNSRPKTDRTVPLLLSQGAIMPATEPEQIPHLYEFEWGALDIRAMPGVNEMEHGVAD